MENKTVQDILVAGLDKANTKLDRLLEKSATNGLRAKLNSFQLYTIWTILGGTIIYIFNAKGYFK